MVQSRDSDLLQGMDSAVDEPGAYILLVVTTLCSYSYLLFKHFGCTVRRQFIQ